MSETIDITRLAERLLSKRVISKPALTKAIQDLRNAGWSREALSRVTGLTQYRIDRIERDHMTDDEAPALIMGFTRVANGETPPEIDLTKGRISRVRARGTPANGDHRDQHVNRLHELAGEIVKLIEEIRDVR